MYWRKRTWAISPPDFSESTEEGGATIDERGKHFNGVKQSQRPILCLATARGTSNPLGWFEFVHCDGAPRT